MQSTYTNYPTSNLTLGEGRDIDNTIDYGAGKL